MEISLAIPPSGRAPDLVAGAEKLGYARAWMYDSPALYPDVWLTLMRCAERTSSIGLGPGVLVAPLRHPMVNAASIAALVDVVGEERVSVAVGTGFTASLTLGQRPYRWSEVVSHVQCIRRLLKGETVEWEGENIKMMHPDGYGPPRPIAVPIIFAATGAKGFELAEAHADGLLTPIATAPFAAGRRLVLFKGTLLRDDEDESSPRVLAEAGPTAIMRYHTSRGIDLGGSVPPRYGAWEQAYADVPDGQRHLEVHSQHLVGINERDKEFLTPELIRRTGGAVSVDQARNRLTELAERGVSEVVYQPGPVDTLGELEAFMGVAAEIA